MDYSERKSLIQAAQGKIQCDMMIRNVRIVNVHTGAIEPGEISVLGGRIVSAYHSPLIHAEKVVDAGNAYGLPGFIDTHVHLDSTLLTPEHLASLIVPCGTTTMLADAMEIANVAGLRGLRTLMLEGGELPYHIYLEVPSRVPTAPGLETTGGVLGLEDVIALLQLPEVVSLGELDPSKVLGLRDEYLQKIDEAWKVGKIANGHTIGLTEEELIAYACGGLSDDHECVDYEDAILRLKLGLSVLVREGSTERNLDLILSGFTGKGAIPPNMMFCTDDKHPDDILEEGHIDFMVRRAIELGISPIDAIRMATINGARHFRIDHQIGSLSSGRYADIILVDDLEKPVPRDVYVRGAHQAHNGELLEPVSSREFPDWMMNTVTVLRGKEVDDFTLNSEGASCNVRVIELYPDQIINKCAVEEMQVENGSVMIDPGRDILKLAAVERYGQRGTIGITFVRGFGMKRGAIASSVAHDHHNIMVVGTNEKDMAACVRAIEDLQGGLAIVCEGKVLGTLPLPIGGLMSLKSSEQVIERLKQLKKHYEDLGGTLPAPFMTLSFVSLPTVPELGLTDLGLIDVRAHKVIDSIVSLDMSE